MTTQGIIDTSAQDKAKLKSDKRQEREDNDIKKLLAQVEFRRFVWRLLTYTGIFKTSFTGNSATFFQEGIRSVGLYLLGMVMRANPMAFAQIQQEFFSERNSEEMIKQKEDLEKGVLS